MAWLSAGAESWINCHVGAFIKAPPPNYRIEHRVNDKVPSSGVSARGAHAERYLS